MITTNKRITKKKLSVLLIAVLTAAIFAACGPNGNEADNNYTNGGDVTTPMTDITNEIDEEAARLAALTPNLPDITFDGHHFRILNTENSAMPWMLTVLDEEGLTGEMFSDAVYHRNRRVEQEFDVVISETRLGNMGMVRDRARQDIMSGYAEIDLYMLTNNDVFALAQDGFLICYHSIPHIDLSRIYWDQDMQRDLTISNRLFTMNGDFTFTHYSATMVLFFNKGLHQNFGLDCPYELVRQGRWTLSAFHEMARQAYADLDGNGIFDHNDQFGYLAITHIGVPALLAGAGEVYLTTDQAESRPVLNVGTQRFVNAYHAILDILHDSHLFFNADHNHRLQDVMFPNDQALFWTELMNWASILREMETDFGILPHPMLDETQAVPRSAVSGTNFMAVPSTTVDINRTGVILEALSAYSRQMVMPVYYDVVLSTVIARDDESGEMLDIIFANRVYDPAIQFFGSLVFTPFNALVQANNRDVSAFVDANSVRIETQIQSVMDRFWELD